MKWRVPFSIIQQRVYERLTAELVGTAVEARIWDSPPEGTNFPLVLIGDMTQTPDYTKSFSASQVVATIDIYSEGLGMEQVHTLANSVSLALTRINLDLSASSYNCFDTVLQSCQTLREFDGTRLIRHALMTFLFRVQDLTP